MRAASQRQARRERRAGERERNMEGGESDTEVRRESDTDYLSHLGSLCCEFETCPPEQ